MIIIAPYAAKLLSGKENPKNYPFWRRVIEGLSEFDLIQVGVTGETQLLDDCRFDLSTPDLRKLIQECDTWISCDSFFQHLAWDEEKPGIVLWSVSDPKIYGHAENINLLKSRDCLAQNQFLWWESTPHDPSKFVDAENVIFTLKTWMLDIKSRQTKRFENE
jgi:ADP-heptose:LPS heptosyltransferase